MSTKSVSRYKKLPTTQVKENLHAVLLDCEQSPFFFRFSKGECTRETRAAARDFFVPLPSRAISLASGHLCVSRFNLLDGLQKKERLLVVYGFTAFSTKHFALNYAQDFRTTVKESLKRTTSSKWATLRKSRIVLCQILSCLCQHSQLCLSYRCKQWLNSPIELNLFKTIFWHW